MTHGLQWSNWEGQSTATAMAVHGGGGKSGQINGDL